jgi:SAM-dependent methyltransferase
LLNKLPHSKFQSLQDKYSSLEDEKGPNKYIVKYEYYIERDLERALLLQLHQKNDLDILDIGSGFGWFGLICRELGHSYIGLDDGRVPLYAEAFSLLGLKRYIHRILPFQSLPAFKEKFDLIACFQICFNLYPGHYDWGFGEWAYFMHNLAEYTRNDTLSLLIEFNCNPSDLHEGRACSHLLEDWLLSSGFTALADWTVYFSSAKKNIPFKRWFDDWHRAQPKINALRSLAKIFLPR